MRIERKRKFAVCWSGVFATIWSGFSEKCKKFESAAMCSLNTKFQLEARGQNLPDYLGLKMSLV